MNHTIIVLFKNQLRLPTKNIHILYFLLHFMVLISVHHC